nr:SJCHGC03206 protein [Schistosoma japonicum]
MPINPVTKKSYHRCPTISNPVVSMITSFLGKGADRLVGLILRLNSFELPSAKDCGLELLSHSLQKNMSSPCLLHMGDLESDVSQTDYGCKVENEDSGICNTPIHSVLTKKSLSIDNLDIDSSASYSAFEI